MMTKDSETATKTSGEHVLALREELRRMRETTIPAVRRTTREADVFGTHTLSRAANLHLDAARILVTQLEGSAELREEMATLVRELESWAEQPPSERARGMRYSYAVGLFEKATRHLEEKAGNVE